MSIHPRPHLDLHADRAGAEHLIDEDHLWAVENGQVRGLAACRRELCHVRQGGRPKRRHALLCCGHEAEQTVPWAVATGAEVLLDEAQVDGRGEEAMSRA